MAKAKVTKKSKQATKPANPKARKETVVAELSEKAGKAQAMVFTNFGGMTHHQIEALKRNLRKTEAEVMIAKNTLVKRALKLEDANPLEGPTATIFAYNDPIAPLKELVKSIKALKLPIIKFGIFEGKIVTEKEVNILSTLPSREILIAKIVGGMKSPLYGLHRALNWNIQKLVMTLKAIETKKSV